MSITTAVEQLYEVPIPLALRGVTAIYALVDPRTSEPRYIGQSNNPSTRFLQHFERTYVDPKRLTAKELWIQQLYKEGFFPVMLVLKEVPQIEGEHWEAHFIRHFRTKGLHLFNGVEPVPRTRPRLNAEKRIPGLPGAHHPMEGIENSDSCSETSVDGSQVAPPK